MDLAPIAGPQTWGRGGISPQDWVTLLPEAAVAELDAAVERLRREPRPAESVAPQDFDLPACAAVMNAARRKLDDTGLAVIDRVPVERYSVPENRAVGWLLASMLGPVVAQTWSGVRLYDVRDTGQKLGYGVRRSVTDLGQPFHTDAGWLWMPPAYVGLFCLESAPEGGVSRFVSLVTAHNAVARQAPELLARLYRPFAWDRQAEHAPDAPRFARRPVFERDDRGRADGAVVRGLYPQRPQARRRAARRHEPRGAPRLARCRRRSGELDRIHDRARATPGTSTTASSLIAEPRSRTPRTARGAGT